MKIYNTYYCSLIGELYIEYNVCWETMQFWYWFSIEKPNVKGVPWPIPNIIKLPSYHYLDVFNTLLVHNNNKLQPPETKEAHTHTVTLYFIKYVQQY